MVQINEIVPSRFREGDLVTINGFGFSPTFGENSVAIDGIPEPLQSESATQITLIVPTGVGVDQYVSVLVFRTDTNDFGSGQAWSSGSVDDLRGGAIQIPGQIPGPLEAADPSRVEDVPQAQDFERMVAATEHLLHDVLGAVGDLFAFDGASIVPQPLGAAGQRLGANPATSTGMEYVADVRTQSLQWAGRKIAANTVLGALVANGESTDVATVFGTHLAPLTGNANALVVLFADGSAGDTLDQVVVQRNGVTQYDSGTGLGVLPGGFHAAALAIALVSGTDTIEVQAKKLGTVGNADFVAHAGVL